MQELCHFKKNNLMRNIRRLEIKKKGPIANQVVNLIGQQGWHFKISDLIYANKVATENQQTMELE